MTVICVLYRSSSVKRAVVSPSTEDDAIPDPVAALHRMVEFAAENGVTGSVAVVEDGVTRLLHDRRLR